MHLPQDLPLDKLTPARLWSGLDPDTRTLAARSIYAHVWDGGDARREADEAIAATLRFRPVTVRRLPLDKRVGYLARAVRPDENLASALLMALHLAERRELLSAFLDELGIPHAEGLIKEGHELAAPAPDGLDRAVARLRERFGEDDVELYLASLLAMDPGTWGGLAAHLRRPAGGP
jgi:hypothetical protein